MTKLSPSAQAVLDAASGACMYRPYPEDTRLAAAAALRAAAELLSKEVDAPKVDGSKFNGLWHSFDYLKALAAELEGQ